MLSRIGRVVLPLAVVLAATLPCASQPATSSPSQPTTSQPATSQSTGERTLEEIREESIARAERGGYPLIGLAPDDVREAFSKITSRDGDQWAAAFMSVAGKYAARAKELAATDPKGARANWLKAWRLDGFGAWPVAST